MRNTKKIREGGQDLWQFVLYSRVQGFFRKKLGAGTHRLKLFTNIFLRTYSHLPWRIFDLVPSID